jgi:NAD+ synthase (glutamine-hydrolysing)
MAAVRVALAQINPTVGDLRGNLAKIVEWIGRARTAGADIVTFPELALCGYPPEDLLLKPRFVQDSVAALHALALQCTDIPAVVGFADISNGQVFNAAALLWNCQVAGVYHKMELPNYGVFDEKRYFRCGTSCMVFALRGVRISVTVCEDIWIPGAAAEECAVKNGVRMVLNLSASPFHAGKFAFRRDHVLSRFARVTDTTICYNNLVGGQDELVFDGGSMVVDSQGRLIASAKRFEEDLLVTEVSAEPGTVGGPLWNVCECVRDLEASDTDLGPSVPPSIAPELHRIEEIYRALVLGTGDYVRKNGFAGVVIGLSGGIDSALTAAVAADALGPDRVTGVTMPSQYTSSETLSDAALLARSLGVKLMTIPIGDVFQAYIKTLEEPFGSGTPGLEFENLQARIRGNILMGLSNRFGWLVLTTGNKSETAVGYCTLYGDTAGGFAVVKDVPKTVVYELSEYVNRKAGREVIPLSVILRAPSAELRPDQKDEDSLPPYAVLDPILKAYVEDDRAPCEIRDQNPALVRELAAMVDRNEYKRRQAPPGVKITPRAFGRDRRLPITNRYTGDGFQEEGL